MDNKANKEIRNSAKENNVKMWRIAEVLRMQDSAFFRKLRHELPQEEKEKILAIIEALANDGFVPEPEKDTTQSQRVLQYMRGFGSITPLEAMADLGVMRLAARIADLRKAGYAIESKTVAVQNRYGKTCVVAQYSERAGSDG